MGVKEDDHLSIIMSANFCSNVIDQFREFINYKINFIDPMIINSTFIMNCYYDTDEYDFTFSYDIHLKEIKNCINNESTGYECVKLCQEFNFGSAGDMFFGNIEEYYKFVIELQKLSHDFDASLSMDPYDTNIDSNLSLTNNFFEGEESKNDDLSVFNLSKMKVVVNGTGLDLIEISKDSKYGYNGEMEAVQSMNLEESEILDDESHINFNSKVSNDTFQNSEERKKFEEAH